MDKKKMVSFRIREKTDSILNLYCRATGKKKSQTLEDLILNYCLPYLKDKELQIRKKREVKNDR